MLFDLSGAGTTVGHVWAALPATIQVVFVLIASVVVFKWCADCVMGVLDEVHATEKAQDDYVSAQIEDDLNHGYDAEFLNSYSPASGKYIRHQLDDEFSANSEMGEYGANPYHGKAMDDYDD